MPKEALLKIPLSSGGICEKCNSKNRKQTTIVLVVFWLIVAAIGLVALFNQSV